MTLREEIAALQARIANAQSDRDTWRASGLQEKYLEACSRVDALALQLERLRWQGLRPAARRHERAGASAPPGARAAAADAPGERERLMAELAITYNGRRYQYDRYRYDRLADAVDYARLQRSRPQSGAEAGPMPPPERVEAPDEPQRRLMASLAITFRDGVYHLGAYRYDRLADAANYARLQLAEER